LPATSFSILGSAMTTISQVSDWATFREAGTLGDRLFIRAAIRSSPLVRVPRRQLIEVPSRRSKKMSTDGRRGAEKRWRPGEGFSTKKT